ncbi:MAG TPA: DUF1232 domain-containing protein [Methanospirillum sp.]|uniref:YkvA family protein n=1 Tax=Methanospirillum sp. TaxID=45200 RepID=UPI002BF6C083|nr:DUF1232 domain-containing protein [Methanospirillum sp.]HOJ96952.1 DUF1232 domain-containing protein [Methanospirillum sp.]HPP77533.1 DUF1232 domain-containing protein [Methanospirillum sp.]
MSEKEFNPEKFVDIICKHPLFTNPGGEITREILEKWIKKQIQNNNIQELSPKEIDSILLQCEKLELINIKRYPQGILITPTRKIDSNQPNLNSVIKNKVKQSLFEIAGCGFTHNKYAQLLLDNIKKFPETYNLTIYLPFFYDLTSNIINDLYTDWHTKLMLSSSLGYIMLQEDLIPDYHPDGYIDDLFVLTYCLRETKEHNSKHIINNNWYYSEDIFCLIDKVYTDCENVLGKKTDLILHKVGLKKFKNLEFINYNSGVFQTLELIRYEKRRIIKLLVALRDKIRNKCKQDEIEEIEQLLIHSPDYDEIMKEIICPSPDIPDIKSTGTIIKEHISGS